MKRIICFLFFIFHLASIGQNDVIENFKSYFSDLEKPVVFDDLDFDVSSYKKIDYDIIKKALVDINDKPYIRVVNPNLNIFYAIGKVAISKEQTGYLLYHLHFNNERKQNAIIRSLDYVVFDVDGKETYLIGLGEHTPTFDTKINAIVIPEKYLISLDLNTNDYDIREIGTNQEYNMEDTIDIEKDDEQVWNEYYNEFKPFETDFSRGNKKYIFDYDFLTSDLDLFEHRVMSGLSKYATHILYSIKGEREESIKNYFIDSTILSNGYKVYFVLHDYKYKSYNRVTDVAYFVYDTDNTLIKSDRLAHVYINKNGEVISISERQIIIGNDNIFVKNMDGRIVKRIGPRGSKKSPW
jgi:hypothetical protein